jgi:hypothetical protein
MANERSTSAEQLSEHAQKAVRQALKGTMIASPEFTTRLPPWIIGFVVKSPLDLSVKEAKTAAIKVTDALREQSQGGKPAAVFDNDHLILGFVAPRVATPEM